LLHNRRVKLVLAYNQKNYKEIIEPLFDMLGVEILGIFPEENGKSAGWEEYRKLLPAVASEVIKQGAMAGALIESNGDRLILVDEKGRTISDDLLTALYALVVLKTSRTPVVVPVTAPGAIEKIARRYHGKVIRTKTALSDFTDRVLAEDGHTDGSISQFTLNFDALGALLNIAGLAVKLGIPVGELVEEVPEFYLDKKIVSVPWEAKGRVIREIIEEPGKAEMELLDGVKVYHPQGWALVLPDPEEPVCRVYSEGLNMEIAESLADFYVEKISRIVAGE